MIKEEEAVGWGSFRPAPRKQRSPASHWHGVRQCSCMAAPPPAACAVGA
jgi:hypothetical protein